MSLLSDLRAKLARKQQVPTYMIFNNKTLEAMVRYQPTTEEAALQLPGIGLAKLQRHGAAFLETIRMWRETKK
jgi:ATP-dependent DNA helicase RecQ